MATNTTSKTIDIIERVEEIAGNKGVKPAQIALAWLLNKKYVTTPVIGIDNINHLEETVDALEIQLNPSDIEYLEEPYQPRSVQGHGILSKGEIR